MARRAIEEGGSSCINIQKLIKYICHANNYRATKSDS
uniref:Uncharacterized protein n=1 Tax=Rhizophora mucronata TaxID=61149 RepID=A0A2P2IUI5_RHIMU